MASKVESELLLYKSSIEKALKTGNELELLDLLDVLEVVPITVSLLKSTLIGHTLNNVKKNMPSTTVKTKAKDLIAKWKSCTTETNRSPHSSHTTASSSTSYSKIETGSDDITTDSAKSHGSNDIDVKALMRPLSSSRVKIIDLIANHLKNDCDEDAAKFMAFCVEDAVNSIYDHDCDKKGYNDKLKSLSFNLKQNEALRKGLIEGSVQPKDLVSMSANDLATEETRLLRGKIVEEGFMERRSDMYEVKRQEIQAANGIDPTKGGEFVCKKCKSNKTTNYQLQTRSSDEPMTVFVRCITCGNRWRF